MSQTTTTADDTAMTAMEIRHNCRDIIALLGSSKADVKLLVSGGDFSDAKCVTVMCFPGGSGNPPYHFIHAGGFPDAFAQAREWAAANGIVYRNGLIHQMAMAIIEITDEYGHCSGARLCHKGFVAAEVIDFHLQACERASKMAGNKPFTVLVAEPVLLDAAE
jgi:hypothetical protein